VTDSYHHSVNNKLLLEIHSGNLCYLICNRDFEPITSGSFSLVDAEMLKSLLNDNAALNQIFGSVQLIYGGSPFVTIPSQILTSADRKQLFQLSHKIGQDTQLEEGNMTTEVTLTYAVPSSLTSVIKAKYPNLKKSHEIACTYKWIETLGLEHTKIYARFQGELLLVLVTRNGKFLLANYFDAKNNDDVFYFIMSVVEQLSLDIEVTTLHWLQTGKESATSLLSLFENYVHKVQQDLIFETSDAFNVHSVGISSILACES